MKYSKEEIQTAVSSSFTITQALNNLGLRFAGANNRQFKKWVEYYSIDISHFDPKKVIAEKLKKTISERTLSLDSILTENSSYGRGHLKNRLFNSGLKEKKCECCGNGEEWMGKKMFLIIDHINGIWNDNRIENLRILCPNCNATLDTHGGKNAKKEKITYYCTCGEKKNKYSIGCIKCSRESRRVLKDRPNKEQLYIDVYNLGYLATGRKYGVSDNAIRKWMKK